MISAFHSGLAVLSVWLSSVSVRVSNGTATVSRHSRTPSARKVDCRACDDQEMLKRYSFQAAQNAGFRSFQNSNLATGQKTAFRARAQQGEIPERCDAISTVRQYEQVTHCSGTSLSAVMVGISSAEISQRKVAALNIHCEESIVLDCPRCNSFVIFNVSPG